MSGGSKHAVGRRDSDSVCHAVSAAIARPPCPPCAPSVSGPGAARPSTSLATDCSSSEARPARPLAQPSVCGKLDATRSRDSPTHSRRLDPSSISAPAVSPRFPAIVRPPPVRLLSGGVYSEAANASRHHRPSTSLSAGVPTASVAPFDPGCSGNPSWFSGRIFWPHSAHLGRLFCHSGRQSEIFSRSASRAA